MAGRSSSTRLVNCPLSSKASFFASYRNSNSTIQVDVRVIAATNRDLKNSILEKRFREDLYFRLAVFPIHSVPLRERREDIPPLASLFLNRALPRLNRSVTPRLTVANMSQLQAYDWPGNIRELENVIERAVILARDGRLAFDLPATQSAPIDRTLPAVPAQNDSAPQPIARRADLQRMEVGAIQSALKQSRGRVSGPSGAADLLEMKATTLYARIKRLGIDPKVYKQ